VRVVMFYHSALSDWNHGNAHFLRGIATELTARGHDVEIYERADAWSVRNLTLEQGHGVITKFRESYPGLKIVRYDLTKLNLDHVLDRADLVIVHEWNEPELVARIGEHRRTHEYCLFFHDTHHRSVTAPQSMAKYDLAHYDGVLAYGASVRDVYVSNGWSNRVWVWHEAADISIFRPISGSLAHSNGNGHHHRNGNGNGNGHGTPRAYDGDLVWIGNWGDDERVAELQEFLIDPVEELGLKARAYGVRYPDSAIEALAEAGIEYGGWLPNFDVPRIFSRFRVTVHIPRQPYIRSLPGIPTIRPFEALACGIPLVCSYWKDSEKLFTPGSDYLLARDGSEMKRHLKHLVENPDHAEQLARNGRETILRRHTCAHRVDELLSIYREAQSLTQGALK
jgi:spore maturation protein CgeB